MLPSTVTLSTSKDVKPLMSVLEAPKLIASEPIVIDEFAIMAFDTVPVSP